MKFGVADNINCDTMQKHLSK